MTINPVLTNDMQEVLCRSSKKDMWRRLTQVCSPSFLCIPHLLSSFYMGHGLHNTDTSSHVDKEVTWRIKVRAKYGKVQKSKVPLVTSWGCHSNMRRHIYSKRMNTYAFKPLLFWVFYYFYYSSEKRLGSCIFCRE